MTSSSGPVPVVDGRREGAVSTRYELRPAHEDTGGDARDRELEPWKSAISGLSPKVSHILINLEVRQWQLSVVRTSPRLASAAAAAARTRRRRSLARRLATRLAADVRCARPTVRSVACAALRAALRALLRCCHPALSLCGAAGGGDVAAAGAHAAAGAARLCDSARHARGEHLTRRRRAGCASLWCCCCWWCWWCWC